MKIKITFTFIFLTLILTNCMEEGKLVKGEKKFEPLSFEEAQLKANSVLNLMTLDEKLNYVGGDSIFFLKPIPRLGIPKVMFADATQGIHIRHEFSDTRDGVTTVYDLSKYAMKKSTAFPAPILLASTWNPDLSYQYAKSIGEECRAGGIGCLLGPGMNIYRISQCGRNFEYFGEDPFLASRMIEKYVQGVQSTGTVATIKHFVANNTDFFRRKSNSVVDERTLHEIYTPAFKSGIDAGAKAVMTSYNLLNGEYCGQSEEAINELLINKLGFKWLVMTDWWSVDDGAALAKSGQDLEMPYTIALKNAKQLLEEGKIQESDINNMVRHILTTCFSMKLYDRKPESEFYNTFPQHVQTALQTAREGIVLLKNEHNILPIKNDAKKILLTGDFVEELISGGGSGTVEGYDIVTMLKAIKDEFGTRLNFIKNPTKEEVKSAEIVLCNIGTLDSEGHDRPFELPDDQENKVKYCVDNNPNTIVIVSSGSGIRMTDWNENAAAILYTYYLGQIGNVALAEILSGKTNPSGKLPFTIEKEFKDSPGFGYMGGEDFYFDWNSEGEKAHPIYDINYKEGVFVGYRWYEHKNIEPLYPFGYGLSYTNFEYSDLEISGNKFSIEDTIKIPFKIKNIGDLRGAETAMLFIGDTKSSVPRPVKELKGFQKIMLNPGETGEITFQITKRDLSYWDINTHDWNAEKGEFIIYIGSSSIYIQLSKKIEML